MDHHRRFEHVCRCHSVPPDRKFTPDHKEYRVNLWQDLPSNVSMMTQLSFHGYQYRRASIYLTHREKMSVVTLVNKTYSSKQK